MFSSAVSVGSRLKDWKTNPSRSRRRIVRSRSESEARSVSPTSTCPQVSVSRPARQCIRVDLPEPDGPMIAVNCAGGQVERHVVEGDDRRVAGAVDLGRVPGGRGVLDGLFGGRPRVVHEARGRAVVEGHASTVRRVPRPPQGRTAPTGGTKVRGTVVPQVAPASSLARQAEAVAAPAGLGGEVGLVDRGQVQAGAHASRPPGGPPPRAGRPCRGCWRAGPAARPPGPQHLRGDARSRARPRRTRAPGWPRRCRARPPGARRRRSCCRARCPGPPGAGRAGSRRPGDPRHRLPELGAAVAPLAAEHVAGQALAVQPHQRDAPARRPTGRVPPGRRGRARRAPGRRTGRRR